MIEQVKEIRADLQTQASPTPHSLQSRQIASDPSSIERYTLCSDFV
jgi:hypothetical protein